jgi:Lrp/AsnC family leucine-responsive transcriptional regulator
MKLGLTPELDAIDLQILSMLQEHCKTPLAKLGEQVGLSAPSVIERIKKLEDSGIITGYHATVDARRLGKDVTAFIGVSISHPKLIGRFEAEVAEMDDVLECHHITGEHSLLLKVKTDDTASLENLISTIRFIEGVSRTETMVVLSTHTERLNVPLPVGENSDSGISRRPRHPGVKNGLPHPKRA